MNEDYPKVSVIIPTYGGSDSLIRAVESVLAQSYCSFDVIVVDDNNPNTRARKQTELMMQRYTQDFRVIYIKHEHNKNGAAARNTGAKFSESKYLCLLDDDDIFLTNRLLYQVEFLENNPEYEACYCWRRQYGKEICGKESGDLSKSLLDLSFTPTTSAIMISKKAYDTLNGFDESYKRHQDYEFLLRFFKKYQMGYVPFILLEFLGNEVDNQVYGKALYNLKKTFFEQFGKEIDRIDVENPGFKKRTYAAHFASAVIQLIRKGNFILAIRMYFIYGTKGGMEFWSIFFKKTLSGLFRKFRLSNSM